MLVVSQCSVFVMRGAGERKEGDLTNSKEAGRRGFTDVGDLLDRQRVSHDCRCSKVFVKAHRRAAAEAKRKASSRPREGYPEDMSNGSALNIERQLHHSSGFPEHRCAERHQADRE